MRIFSGGVPEWLKGADCKSVGLRLRWFESIPLHHKISNKSVRLERFLFERVQLNGRAEAFQAYDEGSIPFTRSSAAHVAQW